MSCGFETEAKQLFLDFIEGLDFDVPDVNLDDPAFQIPDGSGIYDLVKRLTNEDLTTRQVGGDGTFDALMAGFGAHLQAEYKANRITGAEYTKAYIALTEGAMSNATQFLLGRDQAFWAAQLAQIQAITARVQLEVAKVQLVNLQLESEIAKANIALSKGKLATENMAYCTAQFNLENILPKQEELLVKQIASAEIENQTRTFNLENLLPQDLITKQYQNAGLLLQNEGSDIENRIKTFNLEEMLPGQRDLLLGQVEGVGLDNNIKTFNLEKILPQELLIKQTERENLQLDMQIKTFNLENMLPKQLELLEGQIAGMTVDNLTKTFNLEEMLPQQLENLIKQGDGIGLDNNIKTFNLESLLPQQLSNLETEEQNVLKDIEVKTFNLEQMLPQQRLLLVAQEALVKEQKEVQLAQTSNSRTDGTSVTGVLGKQKDLYTQQITSYQRGDEVKAAKLFTDAWTVQKTIDEGLLPPDGFTNASLDPVLTTIKANNSLG